MKKISFNYLNSLKLFLAAAIIIFLLQGCCLFPGFTEGASRRPCNCQNDNKPAYAVNNNKSLPVSDVKQAALTTDSKKESLQTPQHIPAFNTNNPAQETKLNDLLLSVKTNRYKTSEKKLPFGIKGVSTSLIAGPNLSFKSSKEDYGSTDHKNKPGAGVVLGIGTTYYFSEKFAVSTSLLFKQNNATESISYSSPGEPTPGGGNPGSQELKSKYNYSYLSVPVLAEIKLSDQLTAKAGPEIDYLLGASVKPTGYGSSEKTSLTDNSVKVGVGAQLGLRYDFPGSPIGIQLIYDQRISRLNKKNESDYYTGGGGNYETPAWNMKSVQLGVTCALCELLKKYKH